jgi:peptidoglycan/LPS O-acetylase OafA/YrhL
MVASEDVDSPDLRMSHLWSMGSTGRVRRWLLPTPGAHLVQLDALRAFAVLGVLVYHYAPTTKSIAPFGVYGVRLFFVLSGFLITGILLRGDTGDRSRTLRQFYARRFLRIFPAYYLVLFVAAALAVPGVRAGLGWHASYLSNYWFIFHDWHPPNYAGHLWSLAVEEQFYIVAPMVVLFAPRRHLPKILLFAAGAAIASRAGALAAGWNIGTPSVPTVACLDSLGLGALLAVTRSRGLSDSWTRWALSFGVLLLAVSISASQMFNQGFSSNLLVFRYAYKGMLDMQTVTEDTAVALISVWLVAGASRGFRGLAGKVLSSTPLVYLGTISYGVYLYHYFMIWVFRREFGWIRKQHPNQGVYFLTLTTATIAVASISWFAYERPINGLKRYFPYNKHQTSAHTATNPRAEQITLKRMPD